MMTAPARQQVTLRQLCAGLVAVPAEADRDISRLVLDSREVKAGDLFIALQGHRVAAMQFIDDAIEQGAVAVLWETSESVSPVPVTYRRARDGHQVPVIAVKQLASMVGLLADRYYLHPSHQLHVVGITGTNGKTSCSHYLAQALSNRQSCGLIGTLGSGLYQDLHDSQYTTPDALSCHRLLAEMYQQGARDAVMEVSSHALVQHRVAGVRFDGAVFTNLTHEHLDYHGSMQAYGEAKQRLFDLPDLNYAIINVDDPFGRALMTHLSERDMKLVTYGLQPQYRPEVTADDIQFSVEGMAMRLKTPAGEADLQVPLLGRFNASNILAVLAVLIYREVPLAEVVAKLGQLKPVPGRMQIVPSKTDYKVVVDYAHTPDALEQALAGLREHTQGRLICVFGCGGERDTAKRPLMGRLASELADITIITNDNPRNEDPVQIIDEIIEGIDINKRHAVKVFADRREAMTAAIQMAQPGDVVLIAGKGHEAYQIVANERLPFSDFDIATEIMGEGH